MDDNLINCLGDLREYEGLRECIKDSEEQKQYDKCIRYTSKMLQELKEKNAKDYNVWFCYTELARCYLYKKNFILTLIYLHKTKQYPTTKEYQYMNLSLEGDVYMSLKLKNKALNCYQQCLDYYNELGISYKSAVLMANIGHIKQDALMIQKAIDMIRNLTGWNYTSVVDEMKVYLKEAIN